MKSRETVCHALGGIGRGASNPDTWNDLVLPVDKCCKIEKITEQKLSYLAMQITAVVSCT
jgi:hypothetical protein